jgi:hypothetical protein
MQEKLKRINEQNSKQQDGKNSYEQLNKILKTTYQQKPIETTIK